MEIDQEIIAKDIEEVRKHVELDSRDPKVKVYRLCTVCKRPTAGHPPDTRGKYPGYGVNNCKLDKIGDTDANYLCEQLDRIEELKK